MCVECGGQIECVSMGWGQGGWTKSMEGRDGPDTQPTTDPELREEEAIGALIV